MVEGINQVVNVAAVDRSPRADVVGAVRVVDQNAAIVEGSQAVQVIVAVCAQGLGVVGLFNQQAVVVVRAYPNNRVVMRPSETFEAKAAGAKSPQA